MADHSIKLILTREQRRTLDRAAKAAGLKTGPWARSRLLGLPECQNTPKAHVRPSNSVSAPVEPLVKSFDPDKPEST